MIPELARLKGRVEGEHKEGNEVTGLYYIMKEFGYTLNELKEMPIPTLRIIMEEVAKEAKQMKKGMKNHRLKR